MDNKNKTPQRANINGESGNVSIGASPVSFVTSPLVASPQANLTGTLRVAADIAANVYNSIQKWNDLHIQGVEICKQIVNVKLNSKEKFPDGLQNLCIDLHIVVIELDKIKKTLESLDSQMCALNKQCNISTRLFTTRNMEQLAELVTTIVQAYKEEYLVKEHVKENIAHVELNNVPFLSLCWTYQTKIIDEHIDIMLDCLLIEVGHKI